MAGCRVQGHTSSNLRRKAEVADHRGLKMKSEAQKGGLEPRDTVMLKQQVSRTIWF